MTEVCSSLEHSVGFAVISNSLKANILARLNIIFAIKQISNNEVFTFIKKIIQKNYFAFLKKIHYIHYITLGTNFLGLFISQDIKTSRHHPFIIFLSCVYVFI